MRLPSAAKVDVLGVGISPLFYGEVCEAIIEAGVERRSYGLSALAVHGLMECVADAELKRLVNKIDLVVPDGQPVRWAMHLLHRSSPPDKVSGPDLVDSVCAAAARRGVSIFLYGSTSATCQRLAANLSHRHPGLAIAGVQPDRFREASPEEDEEDIARINASGAGVVLVGRGCPRQERWVATHLGSVHAAMLAVGAAFDYHTGKLRRAPKWMQRTGLEWLYRLRQEPKRLLRRYLVTNTRFLWWMGRELVRRRRRPDPGDHRHGSTSPVAH